MTSVLRQLHLWRLLERLASGSRAAQHVLAVVGAVLLVACAIDWAFDRYSGSQAWRKFLKSSWVLPAADPLSIGETPFWLRLLMTASQLALAAVLVNRFILRPWFSTPPVDDLALQAEKEYREFDHRLVTAIQLNRTTADTRGMSKMLIGEVTREAGDIASHHNLLKLVDYGRLWKAAAVVAPVVIVWAVFFARNPALASALVQRQALLNAEIPRSVHLENATDEVWPTGTEVTLRYKVTGAFNPDLAGLVRVVRFDTDLGIKFDGDRSLTITEVEPRTDARRAGLQVNDLLVKLDGEEVRERSQLLERLLTRRPTDTVKLVVKRGGEELPFDIRMKVQYHPDEFYPLVHEATSADGGEATFVAKLPVSSQNAQFHARLGDGRTREPGYVFFEAPPQLAGKVGDSEPLTAEQVLPSYLGRTPEGYPYLRTDPKSRGEIIDALPRSKVVVHARFNKPVKSARLIPIERVEESPDEIHALGVRFRVEVGDPRLFGIPLRPGDLKLFNVVLKPAGQHRILRRGLSDGGERNAGRIVPLEVGADRKTATFGFATTPRTIGYRIELTDDRGFTNPVTIRRNVRMWQDRPPEVEFKPESTRNPDPTQFDGQGSPGIYEWDMALGPDGTIRVIYHASSDVGIRAAAIRYRVIPQGVNFDQYPEEYKRIQHPRDDPNLIVYNRLLLSRYPGDPAKQNLGPFDPELGLFQFSFRGLTKDERNRVNVEFYPYPSRDPYKEPGELEAGGRKIFEVSGLEKKFPDGRTEKLSVGDTVELYVEVFDKLPGPHGVPDLSRPAGYTREAKRKIVLSEAAAAAALRMRDEQRKRLHDKLREIAEDQAEVFRDRRK